MKPIAQMLDDLAEPVVTEHGTVAYIPPNALMKALEERDAEHERLRDGLQRQLRLLSMSPDEIWSWRDEMIANLASWAEPDGLLVPTEPDPGEREVARYNLRLALDVLARILPPRAADAPGPAASAGATQPAG